MASEFQPEPGFDPVDWQAFRDLAHRMLDDQLDFLIDLPAKSPWTAVPDAVRECFIGPVPHVGIGEEAAYEVFREAILPYTNGNRHPRFWGWVQGNGTPLAMMAEMLAAGMNPHCAGFDQASTHVESQLLRWLLEIFGFPDGGSGALVTGATMANLVGLLAARDAAVGESIRAEGLQVRRPLLCVYASRQVHGWLPRVAGVLGLGIACIRTIGVDAAHRIDLDQLRRAIAEDRSRGQQPFCVIGSAGTVNTGATDDLEGLARIAREESLWLHIDGAFGAWARISTTHAQVVRGLEQADSLAFDLHKWGWLPFEIACVLFRDAEAHRQPFEIEAEYLAGMERGVFAEGIPFTARSVELTRDFKALKAWLSFTAYGVERFAACVDNNLRHAEYLVELVAADPHLECLAPVPLNVVCFRFVDERLDEAALDTLNRELLFRLQETGEAVPSSTTIDGRFGLRVAVTNHRTRRGDIERLASAVARIGGELSRATDRL